MNVISLLTFKTAFCLGHHWASTLLVPSAAVWSNVSLATKCECIGAFQQLFWTPLTHSCSRNVMLQHLKQQNNLL
ncbi:hypothetical protein XELAEV_18027103mg [Xenopus laevis]|uniref:Secreted protein n=1 Tax=Xenopus laevis TaxID=8355 RepID=A0A974HJP3_XENLA|nr:hypothetical protein XELAEV_18027103mg [Xenopus laevis]